MYSSSAQPESSSDCPAICLIGGPAASLPLLVVTDVEAVPVVDEELAPPPAAVPPTPPLLMDTEDSTDLVLLSMELLRGDAPAPLQGLTTRLEEGMACCCTVLIISWVLCDEVVEEEGWWSSRDRLQFRHTCLES